MGKQLTVLLLAFEEEETIGTIINQAHEQIEQLGIDYEILVIDGGSGDRTTQRATQADARVAIQSLPGYGAALIEGLELALGEYIITLDVDGSHPPHLIADLWNKRHEAACVIASRFVAGGQTQTAITRRILSRVLSLVYPRLLSLPVHDVSSGYRLYDRNVLTPSRYQSRDFSILLEILTLIVVRGEKVTEVPLAYRPRAAGSSKAKILRFGISYLLVLARMLLIRHSPTSRRPTA